MSEGKLPTRCPACAGALEPASAKWPVAACAECGGIWADRETAKLAIEGLGKGLDDVSAYAATAAKRHPPSDDARPCPVCGLPLERTRVAQTNIDSCDDHGTWFDRGEIGRIAAERSFAKDIDETAERAAAQRRARPDLYVQDGESGGSEVGTAIAGAAAEVAVNVGIEIIGALISSALSSDD